MVTKIKVKNQFLIHMLYNVWQIELLMHHNIDEIIIFSE